MLRRYGAGVGWIEMGHRYDRFRTHRQSRRLAGHDYAARGWTFVTICTAGRQPFFGEIRAGVMGLSGAGCIAHACWSAIPEHVPHVRLDAFVVMPNHIHGLVGVWPSEDLDVASLPPSEETNPMRSRLGVRPGSVSAIVRSYKSAVTKAVRGSTPEFRWQPRFHDHVVRNDLALTHIRAYISANPTAWNSDRLRPPSEALP